MISWDISRRSTVHILDDKSKFVKVHDMFNFVNHFIELADGSRARRVVSAKGRAQFITNDLEDNVHKVFLADTLYVHSYK